MKYKFTLNLLVLLFWAGSSLASSPLPNPEPVFKSVGTTRQNPAFKVETIVSEGFGFKNNDYKVPSYQVGNKAVFVREIDGQFRPDQDQIVTIYVDNKEVGRFKWWGSFKNGGFGYPFKDVKDDPASLKIDETAQTVTYNKPYFTPMGKRAVFSYKLRPLKDSKIELSWELGVTQQELEKSQKDFGVMLWLYSKNYKGKILLVGGKEFKEASRKELIQSKKIDKMASGDFIYNASFPLKGYSLELGDLHGNISESIVVPNVGNDRYEFIYRMSYPKRQAKGKIIIDLGEAALPEKNTPRPVGGIDFWKADATHVPRSPVRNIMPNPSFEQGLRYWTWAGGGATYTPDQLPRYDIVAQGKFGKNALIIRNTQPGASPPMSFPLSLKNEQIYTLSFYAKAESDCNLTVSLASAAKGGKFAGKNGPFGDTWNPDSKFLITKKWQRFSRTFTADAAGVKLGLLGGNNTLIDGIQIEEGDKATEFVSPPLDGIFTTADPDNALVKDKPIDAGFTFTGKPDTVGEVIISVKNAFREIVYSEKFNIAIGNDEVQKINLPFDARKLGEGIFVVKAEYKVKGFAPYFDYYRFSILTPLQNTHATKNIFGTLGVYGRITRGEELALKYMEWGFGSTSWGYNRNQKNLQPYLEKKYRIANIANVVIHQDPVIENSYKNWKSIPPELESKIEQLAYESAKAYDPQQYNIWAFGNEEEGSYLIRNKQFDEYFKAQLAAAKGVKRANPKAIIIPTCGTSGYSLTRGYDAIEEYLKSAQKYGLKYDGIAVHPYWNIDKGALSTNDLDEETARLIAQMKKYGYGNATPIYYTELFNVTETYIPAWGAGTAYDQYQSGKPTYDFGNREFIQAASASRAYIIMLKYWPQLQSSNIWVSRPFMDMYLTPIILSKAVNTLGTHLGDVEYKADIRPTVGVRGYTFKLKDSTGIAPVWFISEDVENGLASGPVIKVKFKQPVEFYDLMGNQRTAKTDKNGITEIQLSPAPLLIKGNNVELLARALQAAAINDSSLASGLSIKKKTN
jgi:hypothetical protein